MSRRTMKTRHRGVTLDLGDNPGGYEEGEAGMTVLPCCSGEGGFGADGEYKKYPETEVVHYDVSASGIRELGRDRLREESFLPSPAEEAPYAPGETSEPGKAPVTKKRERTRRREEPKQERKQVKFSGGFGSVTATYDTVSRQGFLLVLVSDSKADFSYSPPESEDPVTVEYDGEKINAYSQGISFELPGQRVVVLLVE